MSKFINFSNHPSASWDMEQLEAARKFGDISDLPFPAVSPDATEDDILKLGTEFSDIIKKMKPSAVMCQGEFTLSYVVVRLLKESGIRVLSACSERNVIDEVVDGAIRKVVIFKFVRFREYV